MIAELPRLLCKAVLALAMHEHSDPACLHVSLDGTCAPANFIALSVQASRRCPCPQTSQAEDIVKIINEAEITCLIVSMAELGNLAHLVGGCHTVKTFVAMDLPAHMDAETESLLKKASHLSVLFALWHVSNRAILAMPVGGWKNPLRPPSC